MAAYRKAIVAAVVFILGTIAQGLITGEWDVEELVTGITGLVATLGVYTAPNRPSTSGANLPY